MAHHHDDHSNHTEQKPVSFTVPLILGAITVFIIVLFVSLGDPCHHNECAEGCSKECMEACAKGDHSKHPEGMSMEECHKGMEKHGEGHGECEGCNDGKVCEHHAKMEGHAACAECKDGKVCEHHAAHPEEQATPTDTTHHAAEPAKEEAHH